MGVFSLGGLGGSPCGCCSSAATNICVNACGNPLVGAVITVLSGGTTVATCTTTAPLGCCPVAVASGTYTIQVVFNGSTIYNSSRTITAGTSITIFPTVGPYQCCGAYTIPNTLTGTDALGTFTMGFWGSDSIGPVWYACRPVTGLSSTVTTPGGICTAATPTNQAFWICYFMRCNAFASGPEFLLNRDWGVVGTGPGGTTYVWFSQGTSCSAPGVSCTPASPAPCGGLADESTANADPSSTAPFAITFTMAPISTNRTSDPVGGNVTITQ